MPQPSPFLRALMDMDPDTDNTSPALPALLAQRAELLSLFSDVTKPAEAFAAGDLCMTRSRTTAPKESPVALIYLRPLDFSDVRDRIVFADKVRDGHANWNEDCLVGAYAPDGKLLLLTAQRCLLRHLTPDERAELDAFQARDGGAA